MLPTYLSDSLPLSGRHEFVGHITSRYRNSRSESRQSPGRIRDEAYFSSDFTTQRSPANTRELPDNVSDRVLAWCTQSRRRPHPEFPSVHSNRHPHQRLHFVGRPKHASSFWVSSHSGNCPTTERRPAYFVAGDNTRQKQGFRPGRENLARP